MKRHINTPSYKAKMLYKNKLLMVIAALLLAQIIFLANFRILVFNSSYYKHRFAEENTYARVPDADATTKDILDYYHGNYQGKMNVIQSSAFNEREIKHLADVKKLVNRTIYYLYFLAAAELLLIIGIMTFSNRNKKEFLNYVLKALLLSSLTVISVSGALFIASNYFPQLFEAFHQLFFEQGTYVFGETDTLIKLFPESFFYRFSYDIILNSAITAAAILLIATTAILALKKKYINRNLLHTKR